MSRTRSCGRFAQPPAAGGGRGPRLRYLHQPAPRGAPAGAPGGRRSRAAADRCARGDHPGEAHPERGGRAGRQPRPGPPRSLPAADASARDRARPGHPPPIRGMVAAGGGRALAQPRPGRRHRGASTRGGSPGGQGVGDPQHHLGLPPYPARLRAARRLVQARSAAVFLQGLTRALSPTLRPRGPALARRRPGTGARPGPQGRRPAAGGLTDRAAEPRHRRRSADQRPVPDGYAAPSRRALPPPGTQGPPGAASSPKAGRPGPGEP